MIFLARSIDDGLVGEGGDDEFRLIPILRVLVVKPVEARFSVLEPVFGGLSRGEGSASASASAGGGGGGAGFLEVFLLMIVVLVVLWTS